MLFLIFVKITLYFNLLMCYHDIGFKQSKAHDLEEDNMKKYLALILALAMCLSLAACGGSSNNDSAAPAASNTEEAAPAEAETEAATDAADAADAAQTASDSDLAYVQSKGVLVVGITDFEPMDYKDADGNWIGFDADLASKFAASLDVGVEFTEINWDNKILELDGKNIDCIWNGMTLTDEVTSAADCSNPYMLNAQVIVMTNEKAAEYGIDADIESLKDLTYAVEAGSAGEAAVQELGANSTPVTAQADALMEVQAGTSDAAVIDLLMAVAMTGEGTSYENLTTVANLNEEQYGVAFRKGSDLVAALNQFFADAYADGTMDSVAEQYGLSGSVIEQ